MESYYIGVHGLYVVYSPSRTPRRDLYPGLRRRDHIRRLVICNDEDTYCRARVTTDEERVLPLVACTTASTVQDRCPGLPVSKRLGTVVLGR